MINLETMERMETSDADLVAECLTGNLAAFGHIVARYQTLISSLAYSRIGSLERSEELAQDTFLAAWRQLPQLREPQKLRSWLCQIMRNLVSDALVRQRREPSHTAEMLDTAHEWPAPEPLPSEQAVSREEAEILWRALEQIPEIYRAPLVLFYRGNQSVETVAQNLELNEAAVRQRLFRGRQMLQAKVLAFVSGTLKRTSPGRAFSLGVLAALALAGTSARAGAIGTVAATAAPATLAKTAGAATKSGLSWGSLAGFLPVLGSLLFLFKGFRQQQVENKINLATGPLTPQRRREIRNNRRIHGSLATTFIYLAIGCNMAGLAIIAGHHLWGGNRELRTPVFFLFSVGFSVFLFIQAWRSRPR